MIQGVLVGEVCEGLGERIARDNT